MLSTQDCNWGERSNISGAVFDFHTYIAANYKFKVNSSNNECWIQLSLQYEFD